MLGTLLKHGLKYGRITLIDHKGKQASYGAEGPEVTLRMKDSGVGREVAFNPWLKLGESYMDGRLIIERGTLYDLLDIGLANTTQLTGVWTQKLSDVANRMLRWWHQTNPIARSRENVAHHYDLSRKLFSLFLDESMQYSCAYWPKLDISLSDAQQAKMRHIASKLLLEPGQLVLDIGCGWGALGIYLAKTAGVKVIGVTLSKEQLEIAKQRAKEAGLEGEVDFRLQDYREVPERFDRIVSVGMFEHVGIKQYPVFFRQVEKLLKPTGAMLLHAIGRRDGPGYTNPWLRKYIFPGGYSPALSEVLPWIEKTGLWVTDIEILRLHYAETLKAWRANFEKSRAEIRKLYDERFCRMWEFYLIGSELSFRYDYNMVWQIQMARNIKTVPMTRDYMFDWERKEAARAFPQVPWKHGQAAE